VHDESGQTTAELGIILVVLSIAAIAVLTIVAGSVNELYGDSAALIHKAINP
jgi:Flp pilus assembly pilin Flp